MTLRPWITHWALTGSLTGRKVGGAEPEVCSGGIRSIAGFDVRLVAQDVSGQPGQINPYLDGWCVSEPAHRLWFDDARWTLWAEWKVFERAPTYYGVGVFRVREVIYFRRFPLSRDVMRGDKLAAEISVPLTGPIAAFPGWRPVETLREQLHERLQPMED